MYDMVTQEQHVFLSIDLKPNKTYISFKSDLKAS